MYFSRVVIISVIILLASCVSNKQAEVIGQLQSETVDLRDEVIDVELERVMQRLEDSSAKNDRKVEAAPAQSRKLPGPVADDAAKGGPQASLNASERRQPEPDIAARGVRESDQLFEKRTTKSVKINSIASVQEIEVPEGSDIDLQQAGTTEIISRYRKFLEKFPKYERRDQIMYQISRAYEEVGNTEESIKMIDRIIREFPNSRYMDEFQFRKGEYFFTRKRYLDAEEAYASVVGMGSELSYYELSLYKLGWSLYKQDRYHEALHRFILLLDYKASIGYDFNVPIGVSNDRRIEDVYRVMSMTFSNLGGASAIKEYFDQYGKRPYEPNLYSGLGEFYFDGKRPYEPNLYSNLGEYYLDKRRYSDAAISYQEYIKLNPFSKAAPYFAVRISKIYKAGEFPRLVIDAHKDVVAGYNIHAEYWKHHDINLRPDVLEDVKTSLKELANHYHALYQDPRLEKDRNENFREAIKWYQEFLASFPNDRESPAINHQWAALLLENKWYDQAAAEYTRVAYSYPLYEKAADAGFAAIYARRESLAALPPGNREQVQRDIIGSSWKFAEAFPQYEKAPSAMAAAVEDIYQMKEYNFAIAAGRKTLDAFPGADQSVRRAVMLVIGHALFDLAQYASAEEAYQQAMQLAADDEAFRADAAEYLAAAIYKQGELANRQADYPIAAEHFLRIAPLVPASSIRPAADYDGAVALMQLKEWDKAREVLLQFQSGNPGHPLQPEARKNLGLIYRETGQPALAAAEYQRLEAEAQDTAIRRDAMELAADLYEQMKEPDKQLEVYERYVSDFPEPIELALEKRSRIAAILKARNDSAGYFNELKKIVEIDANAGAGRTERSRYLAATAALGLTEPLFAQFTGIKLVQPFDQNLLKKSGAMTTAKEAFEKLLGYEAGDVTSAVTYYLAEMYYNFSLALTESERPADLSDLEKEQYELSIEEQAYPFEEKAIQTHEKNLELMTLGVYGQWIDMSIEKLAKLVPARYAKFEESTGYIEAIDSASYAKLIASRHVLPRPEAVPAMIR